MNARWSRWVGLCAGILGLLGWVRARLLVIRVQGTSMVPSYYPGERLLAIRLAPSTPLRVGDVVVADREGTRVVKRITAIAGMRPPEFHRPLNAEELWIVGDQPGSVDSRSYGPIVRTHVVARVVRALEAGDKEVVLRPDGQEMEQNDGRHLR